MSGKGRHANLVVFGDTSKSRFPLILVIGREANTDKKIENEIGSYDFRKAPRCGFWNTSYGMLARIMGVKPRALKKECIERNGSPIIYADSLPFGLKNSVRNKAEARKQLSDSEIEKHLDGVFSHRKIIERVKLVVASGLGAEEFSTSRKIIEHHCAEQEIPLIHAPFFHGVNTRKIQERLSRQDKEKMKRIWEDFRVSGRG